MTKAKVLPVLLFLGVAITHGAESSARTDLYGEPLPPRAIARLGRGSYPRLVPAGMLAFSPDGKTMASVAPDGTLRLEKPPASLDLLRPFQGPHSPSESVAVSLDGNSIFWSGGTETGFIEKDGNWLLPTALHRKPPRISNDKAKWLVSVAVSPGRNWMAAACPDGTLRIWAAAHPDVLAQLQRQTNPSQAVVFSPDGKQVATASTDGGIRLWDAAGGKEIRRLQGLREAAVALAYSLDRKVMAAAWQEGAIRLWNTSSGQEIGHFQFTRHRCPVYALAISPTGQWVTAAGRQGIQQWNIATRKEAEMDDTFEFTHAIITLAFSPSGKSLALADIDGSVRIKGLGHAATCSGGRLNTEVHSLAFSPDDGTVATAGVNGLRLWEARSGQEKRRLIWNQRESVRAVAFSPDGSLLASGEDKGIVRSWEMPGGRAKQRFKGYEGEWTVINKVAQWQVGRIIAVAFLGKRTLAAVGNDGVVRLWDTIQGQELRSFGKPDLSVQALAFSPKGRSLARSNWHDAVIRLWDTATGREQAHFQGNVGGIHSLAFAPGGKLLATVGWKDSTIRLWDVDSGRERNSFPVSAPSEHGNYPVVFSPDGNVLALMGPGAIRLLETVTGQERTRFKVPDGSIDAFAFSADGKMLASAGTDGTVLIWDVTGRCPEGRWQTHDLTAAELQSCWRALSSEDAASAHRAIWTLAADSRQTVRFLREHLQPETPKDTKRLPALLADLDSDQFAVREAAARELEQLGEATEEALRKVLAGKPTLEVRRRVEPMVKKLERWPASSATALRNWRSLEVLEHLGTPEAQQVLQALVKGAPSARLTQEAKTALERLARRSLTRP